MTVCEVDKFHMVFFVTEETEDEVAQQIFDILVQEEKMKRFYGILDLE